MGMIPVQNEDLARELHEAGRKAVERGLVLNKVPGQAFVEWDDLPEEAREGRRLQAFHLMSRFVIRRWVLQDYCQGP